jgi:hypothetical protein
LVEQRSAFLAVTRGGLADQGRGALLAIVWFFLRPGAEGFGRLVDRLRY